MEPKSPIMNFLCAGKIESAWDIMKESDVSTEDLDCQKVINDLERNVHRKKIGETSGLSID